MTMKKIFKKFNFYSLWNNFNVFEKIIRILFLVPIILYVIFWYYPMLKDVTYISYPIGILLYFILPFSIGLFTFGALSQKMRINPLPRWVSSSIYWLIGLILTNIPAIFTHIFNTNFQITFTLFYLFTYFLFFIFVKTEIRELSIKNYFSKNRKTLFYLFLGVFNTFVFFLWWAFRMDFISFNTDNLQNVNLAQTFLNTRIFNFLPMALSAQYTQVDYSTVFTPPAALLLNFINYRQILFFMSFMEIFNVCIVFITRYYLFREFNINNLSSMLISLISVIVTFSGLYMSGTVYNQQVLVYLFPALIYLIWYKYYLRSFILILALIPFHFTMSVFMLWTSLTLMFFHSFYVNVKKRLVIILIRIQKIVFILILSTILVLEGLYTFETNYFITAFLNDALASRPQIVASVGIYSNLAVLQIMMNGLGPLLTGFLISMPIAWIFSHKTLERWTYIVLCVQLLILSIPFPMAGRTFVFFSVPFALGLYLVLNRFFLNRQWLVNITLILSILSLLFWSLTVRTNDLDITGRYWKYPNLDRNYQKSLVEGAKVLENMNIKSEDYKVISEYFVKQHFEVMANKIDDIGVYEENRVERGYMHDFLIGDSDFSCQYHDRKYLVYLVNERVYRWLRTPKTLALLSAYAIWWSQEATVEMQDYIRSYEPKTTGKIVYDKIYTGFNRMIIIKCL
jgi:hypothetical protein